MDFDNLDFLIYSSHKTSTQTLVNTIKINNYNAIHCHTLYNFNSDSYKMILSKLTNNDTVSDKTFMQGLINYKNNNNKKLRIITVMRNPKERLISSFFQSFSTDEIFFLGKSQENTTVNVKNEDELCIFYEELVKSNSLPGFQESIDEMSNIFQINIIELLEKKKDYYYLNHDLFELYVLDFNKTISVDVLNYLNGIFDTNFTVIGVANLSTDKHYYDKYKNVKKMLGTKLDNIIEKQFKSFYFNSFEKDIL